MKTRHQIIWRLVFPLASVLAYAEPQPSSKPATASTEIVSASPSQTVTPQSFLNNLIDLQLVDQNNAVFEPTSLLNKIVLFNFIFTNCGSICPMQTKVLADVLGQLPMNVRGQVRFISISIDPTNDTPEKLLAFSKAYSADINNWSFLTGSTDDISTLSKRLLIFNDGKEDEPEVHRTSLWLVDKRGRMLQRYRGDPPDKERLIKELIQVSRLTIK